MADLTPAETPAASISTPNLGYSRIFIEADHRVRSMDSNRYIRNITPFLNWSVAAQNPAAATRTYLTGSGIALPAAGRLQVGSILRWNFNMRKTGAGVASSTFDIAFGTAGTTADTARVSFTKPAGTAVVDEGKVTIECIIRTIGATGVAAGEFTMVHNLSATGHAQIPAVVVSNISAGFDMTALTNVGLCLTSGASDAVTIEAMIAEAFNI